MKHIGCGFLLFAMLFLYGCNERVPDGYTMVGQYWATQCGSHFIIDTEEGSLCYIYPAVDAEQTILFDDLTNGDYIAVENYLVEETKPGKTYIYKLKKIKEGDPNDVDKEMREELHYIELYELMIQQKEREFAEKG